MIRQSQKQECQFASLEDTVARLPEPFVAEAPGRSRGNRTRPIGDQTEEFHPHALTTYAALASTESLSVPDDVALRIRLDDTLTSIDSQIGDPFSATVVDKGDYQSARVYGHIAQIDMSGKIKGHTSMLFRRGDQRPY